MSMLEEQPLQPVFEDISVLDRRFFVIGLVVVYLIPDLLTLILAPFGPKLVLFLMPS